MSKRQPKTVAKRKTATKSKAVSTQKPKAVTPKKPAAKPVAKKVRIVKSKAPAKTVAAKKKPAAPKTAKSKPVAAKPAKETLLTLRTHIDGITKRLKTADTLTRKHVKALETAFDVLEKQVKDHHTVNHAALTRRVDQLSAQLTRNIDSTRSEIAADLKAALDNPTITGLQAAIGKSEMRLSQTEMTQSQALAKINKHIAELARIIDSRLNANKQQSGQNKQALKQLSQQVSTLEAKAENRVSTVEDATATAMRRLGDNLVSAAEQFQNKLDQQNVMLRDKIAEIGLQTSKDFDHFKTNSSKRMDSLEDKQNGQNDYIDRAINRLAGRIDNLEYGLSDNSAQTATMAQPVAAQPAPTENVPPAVEAPSIEDAFQMAEQGIAAAPAVAESGNPYLSVVPNVGQALVPEPDAFSPAPTQINPGNPVEFQPPHPQPQMAQQHHYVDPAQATLAAQTQMQAYTANTAHAYTEQPVAYQAEQPEYAQAALAQAGPMEFVPPQEILPGELPYADPGYGEGDVTQGVSRPGHVETMPKKSGKKLDLKNGIALPKIAGLTPKNLRVAGLAVVLAGVGYFGLKSFTGGNDTPPATVNAVSPTNPGFAPVATLPSQTLDTSIQPIGEYEDNLGAVTTPTLNIAAPIEATQSLEQAADGGDAIAQFQLGLYYLDAGRPSEGIKFIRSSANQGQPAAQYRLAKLYEAGIGVQADPDMARQLTERAARSGNRIAMHDLGLYYADGLGGAERDITTALSWFEKAAERGVVDSQYNLGVLFENSPEVPRDALTSFVWYSIAASQGDQVAASRIPVLKQDLAAEQLEQAERRIAQFKPTAIDDEANGIFRNVSWTMPQAQSLKPSATLVRDAQTLLSQLGYEVGTPDGAMGPRTSTAVKAFEKANGMPETGSVSASSVERLEAAAGV